MNEPYSLSDEDVDRYLASKGDDEPVGLCQDDTDCLIAHAMAFKYPELTGMVDVYDGKAILDCYVVDGCYLDVPSQQECPLTLQQQQMTEVFDALGFPFDPIRKKRFVAAWERFRSSSAQA